jgi:CRP-like cAMP-binding protein
MRSALFNTSGSQALLRNREGAMTDILHESVRNKVLRTLISSDFAKLQPHLYAVDLKVHDVLVEANEPIKYAHFIESGVSSLVMTDEAGYALEIAVIGREGLSGIALLFGQDRSSHRTFVQIAGPALRIPAGILQDAMNDSPTLRAPLMLFAHNMFTQVSRSAFAHGHYKVTQRLARWLLLCRDRLDDDEIRLTHGFLSTMLGLHRPGVTIALHELEETQAIRNTRGRIRVRDRAKLEEAAGGCYGSEERQHVGF